LTRQGGAQLVGPDDKPERLALKQRIAVSHDWRLILKVGEILCLDAVDQTNRVSLP